MSACPSCDNGRIEVTLSEFENKAGRTFSTVLRTEELGAVGWPMHLCINPMCTQFPSRNDDQNL